MVTDMRHSSGSGSMGRVILWIVIAVIVVAVVAFAVNGMNRSNLNTVSGAMGNANTTTNPSTSNSPTNSAQ